MERADLYRELVEGAPSSLVIYDEELRIRLVAGRALRDAGADPEQYEGRKLDEVLPRDQVELLEPIYRTAFEGVVRTFRYVSSDDGREYELIVCPILSPDGEITAGIAATLEATAERDGVAQGERRDWGLFRTVFEDAPFGIAVVGIGGTLVEANPVWAATVKRSRPALRGVELAELALPGHGEQIRAALEALIADGVAPESLEIVIPLPDGGDVHCQLALSLARGAGDAPINVIAQLQDISERKYSEAQLRHQADHDPLTDLLNRRAFERELTGRLHGGRRSDQGAMLLVDLDGLKEVNDQFGHPAGDETLRGLGSSLTECVRRSDTIGRVGGDEFAALAGTDDIGALTGLAERILEDVRDRSRKQGIPVSASIGIAHLVPGVSDRELWRRADNALYAAKDGGGDGHVFWSHDLDSVPRIDRGSAPT